MSDSPSSILNKLEELKKWQEKQQERLLEQHKKRLEGNGFTTVENEYIKDTLGVDNSNPDAVVVRNDKILNKGAVKPKRTFLRRGAGLARFRMAPGQQLKPFSNKTKINNEVPPSEFVEEKAAITPLKVPNFEVAPKATWKMPNERELDDKSNKNLDLVPFCDPTECSDRELLIYETLEQRAMQSSFCSTNSSIVRLLSSTPQKNSPQKTIFQQDAVFNNNKNNYFSNGRVSQCLWYEQKKTTPFIEEIDDILEENAETIDKNAQQMQDINEYERKIQEEYLSLIEKAIKFKQYVAGDKSSLTTSSSVTSEDLQDDQTLQGESQFCDQQKWSDCGSSTSSSSDTHFSVQRRDMETMTDNAVEECVINDQDLLKAKVEALEKQLRTMEVEYRKNDKLKSQLELQRREFEKEKKETFKQFEDDKTRANFNLEEEKKKLAKEKMVFERYVKDSQSKPTKKERQEITLLKTEVCALKEALKLKETKNGTAQARLRNQIKCLEKESASLKAEIEKLTRENGKLLVNQKMSLRKPSDTKMLHEINKNLSKLANKDQNEKKIGKKVAKSSSSEDEEIVEISKTRARKSVEKENHRNISTDNNCSSDVPERLVDNIGNDTIRKTDRIETILSNGTKQIKYSNGNVKTVSQDGNFIVFKFYNGDLKETNLLEGSVRYVYCESKIKHTTNADGTELIEFPDGQIEKRLKDGSSEVEYPTGIVRKTQEDGTEEICYPDGTTVITRQGEKILSLPNGQKEFHTIEHKRREYPDGTIKILYPDGLQETRYGNGRIRLKDRNGQLLMDTQNSELLEL